MNVVVLKERCVEHVTDQGVIVRNRRSFTDVVFEDQDGVEHSLEAFIDTGASFSVIPHQFWHGRKMVWHSLGSQLLDNGVVVPNALAWFGSPSRLGETALHLVDSTTGTTTKLLRVVAKFPDVPHGSNIDGSIILGCNFIVDNHLTFLTQSAGVQLQQVLLVP